MLRLSSSRASYMNAIVRRWQPVCMKTAVGRTLTQPLNSAPARNPLSHANSLQFQSPAHHQLASMNRWLRSFSTDSTPPIAPSKPSTADSDSSSTTGSDSTSKQKTNQQSSSSKEEGPDMNQDPLGSDAGVAWWLFGCSGLVFAMVSLGGLTRLTKSGLSMVEWKPTHFMPPRNEEEWLSEFQKYQQFPEYKRVNNQMTLDDFKFIYRYEFYHRLLGRTVGIVFALPCMYFLARGRINRRLAGRLGVAFLAGGAQGAIGWWMVKSGLENPHATPQSGNVHVSPYRLATHLISAFLIYALLFSTALRVHPSRFSQKLLAKSQQHAAVREFFAQPAVQKLRKLGGVTTAVVFATVFSGAFVAGNEAGLVYNEWPLMGGGLIPSDLIHPYLSPSWRNAFENSTMVQFDHRMLAYTTTALVVATFIATRRLPNVPTISTLMQSHPLVYERVRNMQRAGHSLIGMVGIQVGLGIATLLTYVPVSLATLHQAGSLTLLTISLWFAHTLRQPASIRALMQLPPAQRASLLAQLRQTLADLMQGKVHKGTAYLLMAILLTLGIGKQASDFNQRIKEENANKKSEQLKLEPASEPKPVSK